MAKLAKKPDHKCTRWLNPIRIIQRHFLSYKSYKLLASGSVPRVGGFVFFCLGTSNAGGGIKGEGCTMDESSRVVPTWGIWAQICRGHKCFWPNSLNPDPDILLNQNRLLQNFGPIGIRIPLSRDKIQLFRRAVSELFPFWGPLYLEPIQDLNNSVEISEGFLYWVWEKKLDNFRISVYRTVCRDEVNILVCET